MKDHYRIFGIGITASEKEIRRRYRELAFLHHPDKNRGSKKSEEYFKEIVNSYEILSDKTKRAKYDSSKNPVVYAHTSTVNQTKTYSKPETKQVDDWPFAFPTVQQRNLIFWLLLLVFTIIAIIKLVDILSSPEKRNTDPLIKSDRPATGELNF